MKIKNVKTISSNTHVYDIELKDNHFFYANNILTHNCRLRNEVEENVFSYTLGAGGIETGSKCVITLNINRIVQDWINSGKELSLPDYLTTIVNRVHAYLSAWNHKLWDDFDAGILTIFSAGFIELDKQFLTVGVNGFIEGAEALGIKPDPMNEEYKQFARDILGTIKKLNKEHRISKEVINYELEVPVTDSITMTYYVPENLVLKAKCDDEVKELTIEEILSNKNKYEIDGVELLNYNTGIEYKENVSLFEEDKVNIKLKDAKVIKHVEHCVRFNTELIPAENAGGKLYDWDKKDGYWVPENRNLYNSYFYPVEDKTIDPVKKFYYQGNGFATECDGGVALHNNLNEYLSKKQYRMLMDVAIDAGCNYFTYNVPNTICNECGHIDKRMLHECPVCGSKNVDYATRVIGYLKRVSDFSQKRQIEASRRAYSRLGE